MTADALDVNFLAACFANTLTEDQADRFLLCDPFEGRFLVLREVPSVAPANRTILPHLAQHRCYRPS